MRNEMDNGEKETESWMARWKCDVGILFQDIFF